MQEQLHFRISSALKDIIGRDLITDDYIAVFELVKNSYDAYSTRVDIQFENIYSDKSKIIIKDNGKGMDLDDLLNKWLFVAYSAKKEGTEDETFDYRDNIYQHRAFAGAKGIGRFSCDRLGKKLYLETIKKAKDAKVEALLTDWEKFEGDLKEEFIDISVLHDTKNKSSYSIEHGTVLEITELRNQWNRGDLLKLKDSLAKLINPSRGKGEHNFKIFIHVPEEEENDKGYTEYYEKVNGEVENFIFEALELKTTQINASISSDGKTTTTILKDGGTSIYKIVEKNKFKSLHDISFTLFYLNQSAKLTFARRMGVSTRQYGNIFLYKNGFRIYPFGEPGEDPLKIDSRKQQGHSRFLGTRELMGRIEIFGDNPDLRETTSRGDGLIKTKTYVELESCFWEILRRLEKYVIDVQHWGLSIEIPTDEQKDKSLKSATIELVEKLTNSADIIDIEYGDNFLDLLQDAQQSSVQNVIKNLKTIAFESGNENLLEAAKNAEKRLNDIQEALKEAEEEVIEEKSKTKEIESELEEKVSENLFLKAIKSQDLTEVVNLMHHIGIASSIIDSYIKGLVFRIENNINIPTGELKNVIGLISVENHKILSISRFATKANFKINAASNYLDLAKFIQEYLINVSRPYLIGEIDIQVSNNVHEDFMVNFRPLELTMLLDNLINNSSKANAKNILVTISKGESNNLLLSFKDDGDGIEKKNLSKVFNYGFTTTSGSGMGLTHVKEIVEKINGKIYAESGDKQGTTIIIEINK
jgi:signal transduction histidine kinase